MDRKEKYQHWEEIARYDLDTAKAMLQSGRYLYVAFMCQQAIEKIIKGLHVLYTGEEAPKTHNILHIFNLIFNNNEYRDTLIDDNFTEKIKAYKPFLADLVYYYIAERYPSYKNKISSIINPEKAKEVLLKSEEVFQWLQSLILYKK